MASAVTTRLHVDMSCGKCAERVTKILTKLDGVSDVAVDQAAQRVSVSHGASVTPADIAAALRPWAEAAEKRVAILE